jgi:hypothetical protein
MGDEPMEAAINSIILISIMSDLHQFSPERSYTICRFLCYVSFNSMC